MYNLNPQQMSKYVQGQQKNCTEYFTDMVITINN